ncbi:hypothetical protein CHS0354_001806 [Potamilus streckersoni]|uniref:Uncharacterized protein n=1 Tax=Potamilus streckersoni TaxID=2493646 RepID=A0AAE0S4N5_9BIVA|nr:hypothetical protein CHS0354_001806 [Potamilus streckersoni]
MPEEGKQRKTLGKEAIWDDDESTIYFVADTMHLGEPKERVRRQFEPPNHLRSVFVLELPPYNYNKS